MYERRAFVSLKNKTNNKILIVEDEYFIRDTLKIFFDNKCYEVKFATDSRKMLDVIEK